VSIKINHHPIQALIDSGATRSCVSENLVSKFKLNVLPLSPNIPDDVFTADNSAMRIIGQIEVSLNINGLIVPHTFIVLPSLFHDCLLGTDFLLQSRANVDFYSRNVIFYDGLTTLPLQALQKPHHILRLAQKLTIPPRSEAISRVLVHKKFKPQPCIMEGLPSLHTRNLALARVLVTPTGSKHSVCRLLNPTNAPITLDAKTPVATMEPIDLNDSVNRQSLSQPISPNPDRNPTQPKRNIPHDEKFAHLCKLGLPLAQEQMTEEQFHTLTSFLYDHQDLFATSLKDLPGSDIVTHKIITTTNTPIRQRQFRHPPHLEAEIDRQCQKLLDANIIAPSTSPYSSPSFLIKKHDQSYRFVLDYRKLNAITVPQFFPLPTLETCLDLVGQEQPIFFSVCDPKSGYYSIKMDPDSADKTSFSTRSGHYKFLRMPFGLCNAPSTYVEAMTRLLHKELNANALIYLDDLIFFTKTFEGHLTLLKSVFEKFRAAKLRLNPEKSFFCKPEVTYLGHRFNAQGISIDEDKTKAVRAYKTPRNIREVRAFLGLTNYWRRFIRNYSIISGPLRELLLKDVPFKWTDRQEKAFNELKDRLCSSPILGYPSVNSPYILTTDACDGGLGYILSQTSPTGQRKVICYGGRSLKPHEMNYPTVQKELAAVIQAITTWHPYLANQRFTIETDHVSLKYIKDLKLGNSRLIRWPLLLSMYQFDIKHVPGAKNGGADGLSRQNFDPQTDDTPLLGVYPDTYLLAITTDKNRPKCSKSTSARKTKTKSSKRVHWAEPLAAEESPAASDDIELTVTDDSPTQPEPSVAVEPITIEKQQQDQTFNDIIAYLQEGSLPTDTQRARRIILQADNYTIDNDILVHLGITRSKRLSEVEPLQYQICVPPTMREALIEGYHCQLYHIGLEKTYLGLRSTYYWPQMYSQVRDHVLSCVTCQTIKTVPQQHKPPLHSLEQESLFSKLHIDHFGPLIFPKGHDPADNATKHNYQHVLVMIDAFSHYVELVPAVSTSASETAQLIFDHYITRFGVPNVIQSDRGSAFNSALSSAFYKRCGIKHIATSPRHPASNSAAETVNKTIIRALRANCTGNHTWVEQLPTIAMSMRASVSTSLGVAPFKVLYGQNMRLPIDANCVPALPQHTSALNFIEGFNPQLELLRKLVAENVKESRDRSANTYNKTAVEPNYKVGDTVYLRNELVNRNMPPHKLQHQYLGPFTIVETSDRYTVRLQHLYTGKLMRSHVHMSKIKPARLNRHLLRQKYIPPSTDLDLSSEIDSGSDKETTPELDQLFTDPEQPSQNTSQTTADTSLPLPLIATNQPLDELQPAPEPAPADELDEPSPTHTSSQIDLHSQINCPVDNLPSGPTTTLLQGRHSTQTSHTSQNSEDSQSPTHKHTVITHAQVHSRPTTRSQDLTRPPELFITTRTSGEPNSQQIKRHISTQITPTILKRTKDGSHDPPTDVASTYQSISASPTVIPDIISIPTHQQHLQEISQPTVVHQSAPTPMAPVELNNPSTDDLPTAVKLSATDPPTHTSLTQQSTTTSVTDTDPTFPRSTNVNLDQDHPSTCFADNAQSINDLATNTSAFTQDTEVHLSTHSTDSSSTTHILDPLAPVFLPTNRQSTTVSPPNDLTSTTEQPTIRHNKSRQLPSPEIIGRRLSGKKLQLQVRYPPLTTKTWLSANVLPADLVANYMAKTYAIKQKKRSRQRAQFGQR